MERTLISWNLPNWITVMLMAAGGYAILAVVSKFLKGQQASHSSSGGF